MSPVAPAGLMMTFSSADAAVLLLGALAVVGAAVVVFGKNLFRAVLAFAGMLLASAGIFVTMGAGFLAAAQVFVYVGGVVVLLLFGLMLTASRPDAPVWVDSRTSVVGAVAAVSLTAMLGVGLYAFLGTTGRLGAAGQVHPGSADALGFLLVTDWALAFELVGVILLVAAVAAIVIVRRART